MKGIALIALTLLSPMSLAACGEEGAATTEGATASGSGGGVPARPIDWKPLPTEGAPSPRFQHTAVWTGSKMIIWGGNVGGMEPATATGAIYDPTAAAWSPMSMQNAPAPRYLHTAVWTGSKMIVWGGFGANDLAADGAIYDPATDAWSPMATAGQPAPRTTHSAVWTGNAMVIWGGAAGAKPLASGGIYDAAKNSWTAVSASGAPSARFSHSAAFTGSKMIVWGGQDFFDWLRDGASFDPAGGAGGKWISATAPIDSFPPRELHTGVWGTSEMLIWGGWTGGPYEATGALFDPAAGAQGSWTTMATKDAPSPRAEHVGLWTGTELVIWGGCGDDACKTVHGDGGRFTPDKAGGRWSHVDEQGGLSPRRSAAGVTTGSSILIWGGRSGPIDRLGTGAESVL